MEQMNDNYIDVINSVIDEHFKDMSKETLDEYKHILNGLIKSEKEYEFNDDRPRIKTLIETLVR